MPIEQMRHDYEVREYRDAINSFLKGRERVTSS